jgi:hypothetical protein
MSQRWRAQLGLLAACIVLATTMTILYRGSQANHPAKPPPGAFVQAQVATTGK